jgi:hypothetical protein
MRSQEDETMTCHMKVLDRFGFFFK